MKQTTKGDLGKLSDQTLINNLASNVFSASKMRMPILIAFFYYIFKALISVASLIGKLIFRTNLGERSFGLIIIPFVYLLFFFVKGFVASLPELNELLESVSIDGEKGPLVTFFWFLFVSIGGGGDSVAGLGLYELIKNSMAANGLGIGLILLWCLITVLTIHQYWLVSRRKAKGEYLHSYYRGDSIFFKWLEEKKIGRFAFSKRVIWMLIEPLSLFIVGQITDFSGLLELSIILKISAMCLFLEEVSVYFENRKMILDIMDSNIDAEYIAKVQSRYKSHLHGYSTPDSKSETEFIVGT